MNTREFHLGDILSITTGRLVSLRHMDGVYEILNFLTGDNLFTHQLPRAYREMRPRLLAQHPDLAEVDASDVTPENHRQWINEQITRYGEMRSVRPEQQFHEVRDPVAEAEEMMGPDRVILARDSGDAA